MAKKPEKKIVDSLIVKSKVREYIKGKECNTSGAVLDGSTLNDIIKEILDKAIARTIANGRKTVKERYL